MLEMNITPFYPGPNLSKRDLKARTYPYLLRSVPITHSYKWERLYIEYPETALELKQVTKKYMHHYNWNRQHQSLEDQTPASIYFSADSTMA